MKRSTLSLACILKNEVKNLPRLLESVRDCFDEIHLTDTGSDDGSIELIESWINKENPANSKIFLHHFKWCDDFAAARNASFAPCTTDYIMWMDLDDVMSDRQKFIDWRENILQIADFWMATYHYAIDKEGNPKCSFARERIVKRELGIQWKYFIHEGMLPKSKVKKDIVIQYAVPWSIKHLRDVEDLKADKSRNLKIFERKRALGQLDPRMQYYYGKELFENQKPLEAFQELMKAVSSDELELHDRIMGLQYACFSAMALGQLEKSIQLSHQCLQLAPGRAELFVIIGDTYIKMNKWLEAIPFYEAAASCRFERGLTEGAIFSHEEHYTTYPLQQLARIHANIGNLEKADEYLSRAMKFGAHPETASIHANVLDIKDKIFVMKDAARKSVDDIIISCPPQGFYEWDENAYKERGIGGSETAAVEMAHWMSKISGRTVRVFNNRTETKSFGNVHYQPAAQLPKYLSGYKPAAHIAWRHVTKFNDDPLYVWCHDLGALGLDDPTKYHRLFALSNFHKTYLKNMFQVSEEKMIVTSNGIDPTRFTFDLTKKEFGKVIFSSSPDRGLENAIHIMDKVVSVIPEAKLHCFYGFDNMLKLGKHEEVNKLEALIKTRPHVIFKGNISQKELTREMAEACVWLYPTNFLETYCITAIEALASHVYPIVREWGALQDTLASASADGFAELLDIDPSEPAGIDLFAEKTVEALMDKKWEKISFDARLYSWESVAREWLKILNVEATDGSHLRSAIS